MKTCSHDGCNSPVFSHLFCKYHQYERRRLGGDLFKRKPPKAKAIPKQSPKRKITVPMYTEITQKLWDDAIENKTNFCFFCNREMYKKEDAHHLKGRDGFLFIDPDWLVIAHTDCHFWKYHRMTVEQLKKIDWYEGFLLRLKEKDESLWREELKKQDKSEKVNKLNPSLFEEIDDDLFG